MEFQLSYSKSWKMMLWKCCNLIMPANLENSAVVTGLEKVSFHSNPKEGQCQRMLKLPIALISIALISQARNVMLKILQTRLQQYVSPELPDVQAGFRKCKGTRDQKPSSAVSLKKQASSRKTPISALLTMPEPLTLDHNKLENSKRDGNTRTPDLPFEKSECRSGSNS